jgi:hypothetical protein
MAVGAISSGARMELARCQQRLAADTTARDAAQRAVNQDGDAVPMAQPAARRELQARSARGTLFDVMA